MAKAPGWLQPLAIGTAGGALANQLPSFEEQRRLRENRRRRRQRPPQRSPAKVQKDAPPTWPDDGFFNAQAAQQAYDLVMKMDDDSAAMFATILVSEVLEADIEANRRTLQKHLDEVVAKQLTDLKRATMRVVAKSDGDAREQIGFAQALAVLEQVSKLSPYDYGYVFRESDVRRAPSGQFTTKVKRTQTKPINDKVARSMGIPDHPRAKAKEGGQKGFSDDQKAQYQDEYRQLANFLRTVHQSTPNPGDANIRLHFVDNAGNAWVEPAGQGTRPRAKDLDPRDRTLVGISAAPQGLTVGGAAFGLTGALGGSMAPMRAAQLNAAAEQMPGFAESWTKDYGRGNTNAQLYGRVAAGSKVLSEVAPAGTKANLAGHVGQFVGQYGPQAEAVIGPPARKTAYRYRGTEKTPDKRLVRAYAQAINESKKRGVITDEEELDLRRPGRGLGHGSVVAAGAKTTPTRRRAKAGEAPAVGQMGRAARTAEARVPTWEERDLGRQVIVSYLNSEGVRPKKGLYNLQLASGNTPPSEGVILDRDGQIVSQAIGYGDDHYLPFNLKNLKALKGGEYIRNRSVGGLTSEDIYTGLVSGARQVTVVSRSGTFTMEFEPDFRGGRRHNDKAMRMTRRYEQLLDAVQSEQVERQKIDPDIRRAITESVRTEAAQIGRGVMSNADIRAEIDRRIEEYKASPDLDADTQEYINLIVNNRTAGMTSPDARKIEAQVRNDVAADKEYKFRLNGAGYAAALESLREQFPYYIKVNSQPTRELERHETEPDLGYVEPGRIRPTAAAAGLFGGARRPAYDRMGDKISAAEADYAGGFRRPPGSPTGTPQGSPPAEGEPTTTTATTTEGEPSTTTEAGEPTGAPKPVPDPMSAASYADKAVPLQQAIKNNIDFKPGSAIPAWRNMDEDQFRAHLQNRDNLTAFDNWITQHQRIFDDPVIDTLKGGYEQAAGRVGQKLYETALNQQWGPKPYRFDNEAKAYRADATANQRQAELNRIGAMKVGVVNLKPIEQMNDTELQSEMDAVARIRRRLSSLEGNPSFEEKKEIFTGINKDSPTLALAFRDEKAMDDYLETIHRTRAINHGVPEAERGRSQEKPEPSVVHNPITEANSVRPLAEKMDRIKYLADKTMELHAPDTPEYQQLRDLRTDLGLMESEGTGTDDLIAMPDAHPEAFDLIMGALHSGRVSDYQPEPEQKPPGQLVPRSGPILT
jgi:hypothetical protein